ncbi:MAG: hypothetical protein NT013_31050 [Planctomycetia bacterium]|nr:hypothetical protein [Planctomycetia bacterium]
MTEQLVVTSINGLGVFLSPVVATASFNHCSDSGLVGIAEDAKTGGFDGESGNDISLLISRTYPGLHSVFYL